MPWLWAWRPEVCRPPAAVLTLLTDSVTQVSWRAGRGDRVPAGQGVDRRWGPWT